MQNKEISVPYLLFFILTFIFQTSDKSLVLFVCIFETKTKV